MKSCYVFRKVLSDYTSGMIVMIAENLEECKELFLAEELYGIGEFEQAIDNKDYHVIPVSNNEKSRIVEYVYGGG